jgi:two-component system chemotaxis response regulator CheB
LSGEQEEKLINATCPDCRGPLTEVRHEGGPVEYRCLVGHRFSARILLAAHSEAEEKALWAAVVALEEVSNIVRELAPHLATEIGDRLRTQAQERMKQASAIRGLLLRLAPFQVDGM